MEVHLSSLVHFGGHLSFTGAADKEQYATACIRKIILCKFIYGPTLDLLNIRDEVTRKLTAIGWTNYASIVLPAFIELIWEFYATF